MMTEVTVIDPALLIRIAKLYRADFTAEQLYEAVRGVWRLGVRRENVKVVLAVANGVVLEVFTVHRWHPAGSTKYHTRPLKDTAVAGRWEFSGVPAPASIRARYFGKSVQHYFDRGAVNPILYVNV